ncbi:hypothetical protein MAR_012719 [Mya arenaria]|uniref:SWIM-type domain-containing protein n=1 Tax=Mya arenaria TaxID=6604 RepID=A0ABY7FYF7_MYAAR|nr:hypothetical protein MAR_012719 [Mya arenaria]
MTAYSVHPADVDNRSRVLVKDVFIDSFIHEDVSNVAKVLHSQRLNEKPLRPWIIAERDGPIIAGHCTCMAGLGETCTHVASLLFCIEAVVKLRESRTVTEVPA